MNKKKTKEDIKALVIIILIFTFIILLSALDVDSTTPKDMIKDAKQQAEININSKK